jgi:hypothetical protein
MKAYSERYDDDDDDDDGGYFLYSPVSKHTCLSLPYF